MKTCLLQDCYNKHKALGYCNKHYSKFKNGKLPEGLDWKPFITPKCRIEGCDSIHFGKGYCKKHYVRYWRYGSPFITQKKGYPKSKCRIEGCGKWCHGNGYCMNHYIRLSNPRNLSYDDLFMFTAKYNVKIRDKNKCQWYNCNRTSLEMEIHVHHIFPINEYPELKYREEYMISYCKNHHAYWHQVRGDKYHNLIRSSNKNKVLEVRIPC